MPAPAVIPAPIAYIIDVAVETFVVELYVLGYYNIFDVIVFSAQIMQTNTICFIWLFDLHLTLSESACSTQACALNDLP